MNRIRVGMVGGGEGAMIGAVHRTAMAVTGRFELVAGAVSSRPDVASRFGLQLGLAPERCYADFRDMARAEAARPDGIRAVVIVTPNHLHVPVAQAFLAAGIDVVCDKPLSATLAAAQSLRELAGPGRLFVVTFNYSAYPMVRLAREMVARGDLGALRIANVQYAQDWLATAVENGESRQARWRTDPAQAGAGGCIGDIGSHAYQMLRFVCDRPAERVSADLSTFVGGRRVDDDVHVRLRLAGGVRATLWASQVAIGSANDLRLRIVGDRASLSWRQESPDELLFCELGRDERRLVRGASQHGPRGSLPAGHPEGYLDGFANLYRDVADALEHGPQGSLLPTLADGIDGMRFIDAAIRSSRADGAWTSLG